MKSTKSKGKTSAPRPAGGFGAGASGFGGFGGFGGPASGSALSYLAEPPSFSAISDPHVVVSLKNVLKKDSTTKAKAMEDLVAHVQAHPFEKNGGVEEAILDVWDQLYPRTAIDNARRVRELSHALQFELMKSARKRMERHIPTVVGAWLAGLCDRDRAVARAANDGLASFLTTPEKVLGFWRKCQGQILDYATEAIRETEETLSDERTTNKEDSQAKYFRVVTASLSLVLGLLQKMTDEDIAKEQSKYDDYFAEDTVWGSITFSDSAVRKMTCQVLFACLDRKLPYAEGNKVKQAIVTGGLRTNQVGSALEYVRALTKLTQSNPDIWAQTTEKKSPISRLRVFIAKGSQGSAPKFWEYLDQLLGSIQSDNPKLEDASALLTSLKSGVTNREEPRTNTSFAWKCYIDTAKRLLNQLVGDEQVTFGKDHLFPLFEQFLFNVSERPTSIPLGPNAMSIFVEAYVAMATADSVLSSAFSEQWDQLASTFAASIGGSLPEVSKDFQSSQEKISEEGRRWFGLSGQIHQKIEAPGGSIPDFTVDASAKVLSQSTTLLASRNLKPFGAAQILEYALSTSSHLFKGDKWSIVSGFLLSTAEDDIEKAIGSPSARSLLSCVRLLGTFPDRDEAYSRLWNAWTSAVLSTPPSSLRDSTLASLISHQKAAHLAQTNQELQSTIVSQTLASAKGTADAWDLLDAAITYQALDETAYPPLAKDLVDSLDKDPQHLSNILKALELMVKGRPQLFAANEDLHATLVAHLLSLSELSDSKVSAQTQSIRALLDTQADGKLPVIGIIQSNLDRSGPQSLDIDTVVTQAENATDVPLEELFPSTNVWKEQLDLFFNTPIDPSLSITSNIGGAITVAQSADSPPTYRVQWDRKGRSIPVRMALYLHKISDTKVDFASLPDQFRLELLYLQCITAQVASDQITMMTENGLWGTLRHTEAMAEAENLVSSARSFVISQLEGQTSAAFVNFILQQAGELSLKGVYTSRVLSDIIQSIVETEGLTSELEALLLKQEYLKSAPETFLIATAVVSGLAEHGQTSKQLNNFCNRLVSDAAGASPNSDKAFRTLALLSLFGKVYDSGEMPVANNRVVFAVKQITSWLDEPENLSATFSAEICRSLTQLLPCMKDVYGSYWETTLDFCSHIWDKATSKGFEQSLPAIHASLKLIRTLETLPEPNDDLEDALKGFAESKSTALIELLKADREKSSQPLEIVDGIICREVEKLPLRRIPDAADIFPLVASESRDIQTAAFNLLHKAIPAQQEQKSVEVLLEKTDARLPDELLSLLLDAPTLESYSDDALAQFPSPVRCYLLGWKLVFDAFSTSSFKVKNDFTEHLKAEGCITPLLDFMFDVLGHSAAHALKLEKEGLGDDQIKDFDIKLADTESGEKAMQWLLVHSFYLTLKYIPGLFRLWYIDCRSKQTRIAVEAWTTKYFSPLIIDDTLDEVQRWADTQEPPAADEQELSIKVSRPAREITAGYEIDEDEAAIVIKVPSSYPIDGVTVNGLRRVAVNERKWQSWIMTTQGVITFSNGNIIDGLQVFKRNIVGAMKGQGECAICYSIISSDKRVPDKRCTTCKNLFHRTCLYKWFQSSNQNTCPLCRNPIDYLGADTQKRRQ